LAPRGNPPIEWDETKNVQWKVALPGEGHATPIIWGDQVFALAAVKTDRQVESLAPPQMEPPGGYKTPRPVAYYQFTVICIDRHTGDVQWQRVAREVVPHEGRHGTNTYASASPTTDGRRIYVSFGSQGVFCYDLEGTLLWDRDLGDMVTRFGWGEGTSPVICGDSLIVNWDHEGDSFLVVLDPATGETRWRAERDEASSWVTPRIVDYEGRSQLIVPATRRITSYDLATGQIIWECGGLTTNVIPCPVVYQDLVICMSGHRGNELRAVRLNSQGDVTDDARQVVWQSHSNTPYVPSPLLYGQRLFFTKSNTAILTCLNPASGQSLVESVRLPEIKSIYASLTGAADRIYITGREGVTLVIRNQPKLDVLAINKLPEGIDASPAIVGRELFLRGERHLYKIAEP
jgi:outer membrane protein assembly factor BamB